MYAIGANGVDFWGEAPASKPGTQKPRSTAATVEASPAGGRRAVIRQTIDWIDADGNALLQEQRAVSVLQGAIDNVSLITWAAQFQPAQGKDSVELWGRHYFGLGMRFIVPMDNAGTFLSSDAAPGEAVRGSEQLIRAKWCAYQTVADGKPITVAMFGHPDNPRHPVTWFTMNQPFAYLSATLNLSKEPLPLAAGQTLNLRYGVASWDSAVNAEQIERGYQRWVELEAGR